MGFLRIASGVSSGKEDLPGPSQARVGCLREETYFVATEVEAVTGRIGACNKGGEALVTGGRIAMRCMADLRG